MIGHKLKAARESKRYSQEYVAVQCGIEQSSYSRIESGNIKPKITHLRTIAKILNLNFHELIDGLSDGRGC
jgi:transcriptional regulator with XRE-family HTH domain